MTVAEISHMTDDLLSEIFYHLCDPGPLSLRHLLFVSRRFYSVVMNSAHLWTTISFDPFFFYHFRLWHEQSHIFVEQCLLRSGSLELCLYIEIGYHPYLPHHFLEIFWRPEWRALQRYTSMIWINRNTSTTIQEIVALLPKSLPSLQYMSLSFFDDPIDGSQFPNCPVLERVEMLYYRQHCSPFWGTNFLHVTTLYFGYTTSWAYYDATVLSQFPVLHDLTLLTEHYSESPLSTDPHPPINFNRLQILRARGSLPWSLVCKLVAPALKELHIKANVHHVTSICELQDLFEPHCQHIYALLPISVSRWETDWATNLSILVQKCTRIKSLHIYKWMEEECKEFMSRHNDVVLHVQ